MGVAWSYSALGAFETCARRFQLTKVLKTVTEPMSPEMGYGNKVHKALEDRLTKHTPLPQGMEQWERHVTPILASGGKVEAEQKMALTSSFKPTSFFAKDCWVRAITDVTVTKGDRTAVLDWKTGKPTPESAQLKLCAAVTMHVKPFIQRVTTSFVWLKTDQVTTESFTRDDIPAIWQEFAPRVQRMEIAYAENKWPAKPSGLCKSWCPCTGCEFNGNYKNPGTT